MAAIHTYLIIAIDEAAANRIRSELAMFIYNSETLNTLFLLIFIFLTFSKKILKKAMQI